MVSEFQQRTQDWINLYLTHLEQAPHNWRSALQIDNGVARLLFPNKMQDIHKAISGYFNDKMTAEIEQSATFKNMRVHEKITEACLIRLRLTEPYKPALKKIFRSGLIKLQLNKREIWAIADRIWDLAGDTSTDYNHYTKRFLLSGVLSSTFIYFLSNNFEDTKAFLSRRIENVLKMGKVLSSLKAKIPV